MAKLETLPTEITAAIKDSILGFLHHVTKGERYTLTKATRVQVYGSELNGKFARGLVTSRELPAGTDGWLFRFPKVYYSKYNWVFDEQWPAADADRIETGCSFMFITLVEIAGERALADAISEVTYPEPRITRLK